MPNPMLLHPFHTRNSCYVYDASTNEIVGVDRNTYDMLGAPDCGSPGSAGPRDNGDGTERADSRLVGTVRQLQAESGLPLGAEFSSMSPPVCENHFHQLLDAQMHQLLLDTSERCNLRCKYCLYSGGYSHERRHSSRLMSEGVALKALGYFLDHSRASEEIAVSFYGGEPLTNLRVIQACVLRANQERSDRAIQYTVDTNATLMTDEILDFLFENDFTIQVSLDGPRAVHDRYRVYVDQSGTFDRVMQVLKQIHERSEEYFLNKVVLAVTIAPPYRLPELASFFSSIPVPHTLSVNMVGFAGCDPRAIFGEDAIDLTFGSQCSKMLSEYIDQKIRSSDNSVDPFLAKLFEAPLIKIHRRSRQPHDGSCPPNGICLPGSRRLFVTVDGTFYPCERVGESFPIGSVEDGVDKSLVQKLIDEYIAMSVDECTNCWACRLCNICFAAARASKRLDPRAKRVSCESKRAELHQALVNYAEIMEANSHAFDFVETMVFV